MRDKLIDIILDAQGYQKLEEAVVPSGYWRALALVESEHMRDNAEKIADALIAAGVMLVEPVAFPVGHPDPVGEKGEPGVVGIPAGEWVSVKDALPEKAGKYLVTGRHFRGEKPCVWLCEFAFLGGTLGGWCNNAKNPMVRAWMPLPALPKEE